MVHWADGECSSVGGAVPRSWRENGVMQVYGSKSCDCWQGWDGQVTQNDDSAVASCLAKCCAWMAGTGRICEESIRADIQVE